MNIKTDGNVRGPHAVIRLDLIPRRPSVDEVSDCCGDVGAAATSIQIRFAVVQWCPYPAESRTLPLKTV
jgi:hypothetical protein